MREEDFILNKPRQYPRPRERRQTDETQQLHLTHLPPYSEITVQVRVLNKYYASEASERIYFITHESGISLHFALTRFIAILLNLALII